MEYYTEKTQVPFCSDARQGMKIVGIYSPSEICANCLFALAAAQILGEEKGTVYQHGRFCRIGAVIFE